jgi:NADH-quinone oxidoreductase subunit H
MRIFGAAPANSILDFLNVWFKALLTHWGMDDWLAGAWASGLTQFVGFLVVVIFIVLTVLFVVLFERRIIGFFQLRLGPNRVGPQGLFQTIADALKLLQKEDIMPLAVEPVVYNVAPFVVFVPSLVAFVVIPMGAMYAGGQHRIFIVKDLNIGIMYLIAVSSVALIGFLMAGWGSNNKYALISAIRAAAQIISYEVPMILAILGVVLVAGTTSMVGIVHSQTHFWNIVPQLVGFIIYLTCGIAETNRAPFDLPEAESEIVAGFHTEYSGMKFALYFLAEYTNVFVISAIVTTLFLGGWKGPMFLGPAGLWFTSIFWFMLKTYILVFVFVWLRATLPRFRVDHMMAFAWKFLIPVSVIHVTLVAASVAYSHPLYMGSPASITERLTLNPASVAESATSPVNAILFNNLESVGGVETFANTANGTLSYSWMATAYRAMGYNMRVYFWVYTVFALFFLALVAYTAWKVIRGVKMAAELEKKWQSTGGGKLGATA